MTELLSDLKPEVILAAAGALLLVVGAIVLVKASWRPAVASAFLAVGVAGVLYWRLVMVDGRDGLTPWMVGAAVVVPALCVLALAPARTRPSGGQEVPTSQARAPERNTALALERTMARAAILRDRGLLCAAALVYGETAEAAAEEAASGTSEVDRRLAADVERRALAERTACLAAARDA